MNDLTITGGRVWDGSELAGADLAIRGSEIVAVGAKLDADGAVALDASGCIVMPGLVDIHVHFREPGEEEAEDILSGSAAAAAGGYTDVVTMPNTKPAVDTAQVVASIRSIGDNIGLVRVHPAGCVTRNREGGRLAELNEMHRAGVRVFTDDGSPISNSSLMRRALEYVSAFGGVVADHCQDLSLTEKAQMHEGDVSGRLGLPGWPASAEEIMVARDILLAGAAGARVHLQHISSAWSVELIRHAKDRGIRVTAEVTPHHLALSDKCAEMFDPVFKVNPPIRDKDHIDVLRRGLADGTIDAVATDHAPHKSENKEEWTSARPGMLGLETALPVVYELVGSGEMTFARFVDSMATMPAQIAGLPQRGALEPGAIADLCIFDPNEVWEVDPRVFMSKSRNSPFAGMKMQGRVRHTVLAGRPTCVDGRVTHERV